jgi:hypothetical protein
MSARASTDLALQCQMKGNSTGKVNSKKVASIYQVVSKEKFKAIKRVRRNITSCTLETPKTTMFLMKV